MHSLFGMHGSGRLKRVACFDTIFRQAIYVSTAEGRQVPLRGLVDGRIFYESDCIYQIWTTGCSST